MSGERRQRLQLQEWYRVEPAGDVDTTTFTPEFPRDDRPLAIILSRPRPVDAEIRLLVQLRDKTQKTVQTLSTRATDVEEQVAFHCDIIYRVKVSRDTMSPIARLHRSIAFQSALAATTSLPSKDGTDSRFQIMIPSKQDDEICLGEILESDQIWYVDSFSTERSPGKTAFPELSRLRALTEPTSTLETESGQSGPEQFRIPLSIGSAATFEENQESARPKSSKRERIKSNLARLQLELRR